MTVTAALLQVYTERCAHCLNTCDGPGDGFDCCLPAVFCVSCLYCRFSSVSMFHHLSSLSAVSPYVCVSVSHMLSF